MNRLFRHRFPSMIILQAVRWYLRYNLSLRDLEEMLHERGVRVSHKSIHNWVFKFGHLYDVLRKRLTTRVTLRWHLDETYVKVNGVWNYLWRAIDSEGNLLDFFLSPDRNAKAARTFLQKAVDFAGQPESVTTDKYRTYIRAVKAICPEARHHKIKYRNNMIEQNHRRVKKRYRTMKCFKEFEHARRTLMGIEGVSQVYKMEGRPETAELDKEILRLYNSKSIAA